MSTFVNGCGCFRERERERTKAQNGKSWQWGSVTLGHSDKLSVMCTFVQLFLNSTENKVCWSYLSSVWKVTVCSSENRPSPVYSFWHYKFLIYIWYISVISYSRKYTHFQTQNRMQACFPLRFKLNDLKLCCYFGAWAKDKTMPHIIT